MISVIFHANLHSLSGNKQFIKNHRFNLRCLNRRVGDFCHLKILPMANFEGNIIMISVIFHANLHSLSGNKQFIKNHRINLRCLNRRDGDFCHLKILPKANFEGNIIMISVIFHANLHSLSGNKQFIKNHRFNLRCLNRRVGDFCHLKILPKANFEGNIIMISVVFDTILFSSILDFPFVVLLYRHQSPINGTLSFMQINLSEPVIPNKRRL
jgi:NTP pyrophosphatase (non-canonical NTP hydrolase)